jgi:sugar phosphate isomerase/epimerase
MQRPVTLFTGQWADLPIDRIAELAGSEGWGYDGLELACWGDHFDVRRALAEKDYCRARKEMLNRHGLGVWAISNHLVGQCVCDVIDERHKAIVPEHVWGDGEQEGVRRRAAEELMNTARAAARLEVDVVNGFTGSSIWPMLYFFPPTPPQMIDRGYAEFAERWGPILDVFQKEGVAFALEVHPSEIAYDLVTAGRALRAVNNHPSFGFNFDPSHFQWQGVDPAAFVEEFGARIFHCHMKDAAVHHDGRRSILGGHMQFGDARRAWDFRSPGRGEVDFERVIRALNRVGYAGPLSVEWEDPDMAREHGAAEAVDFVRGLQFPAAGGAFDSAFAE